MTSEASKKPLQNQTSPPPPQAKEKKTKLLKDCIDLTEFSENILEFIYLE